ncbi:helix-turn-helix domain-containing protein [Halomarina halobia]
MIIVEFALDHPILRDALDRVPETTVQWERSDAVDGGRVRVLVWAEGDDLDAFEAALADDPTVAAPSRIVEIGGRRLYLTELRGEGLRASVYPLIVEEGGIIRDLTATREGWEFRVLFPTQRSLDRFFGFCSERGFRFEVHRVYEERGDGEASDYGLTAGQREVLATALEIGFLEVPRERTLADLAKRLGVSDNAASQRFRRAVKALTTATVCATPDRS